MVSAHPQGGDWQSVAAEASTLVFGPRGAIYNHPADDYFSVCEIADAIIPDELRTEPVGAILQMLAVKLARLRFGLEQGFPPEVLRDHFVDACGYLDCAYGTLVREYDYAADDLLAEVGDDE